MCAWCCFTITPALLGQVAREFNRALDAFVPQPKHPVLDFERGERKDDVAGENAEKRFTTRTGGLCRSCPGKAARLQIVQAQKQDGRVDFCFSRQSVCVKHYYFWLDDEESGPCFIRVGTYFSSRVRLLLHGHEGAKRAFLQKIEDQYGKAQRIW